MHIYLVYNSRFYFTQVSLVDVLEMLDFCKGGAYQQSNNAFRMLKNIINKLEVI